MSGRKVEDIYQATIMDRARHPRHRGRLAVFDAEVLETNPLCADRLTLTLKFSAGGGIAAIGYHAQACAICVAATDLMAEVVRGMTPDAAEAAAREFEAMLRMGRPLPPESALSPLRPFEPLRDVPCRIGCAMLPWRAMIRALGEQPAGRP